MKNSKLLSMEKNLARLSNFLVAILLVFFKRQRRRRKINKTWREKIKGNGKFSNFQIFIAFMSSIFAMEIILL